MRSLFVHNRQTPLLSRGFTLVEMLVVVPIVLLVIGVLVTAMVAMTGDTLVTNARSSNAYALRDTLSRIEEDTRISGNFMNNYTFFPNEQSKDGSGGAFTSASGDLIMTQQATTANPYNSLRDLVYYSNQPNACSGDKTANRALLLRVVYFLKDDNDGDTATKTLWRRTIVRDWNTTKADSDTTCTAPWQKDTCPETSAIDGTTCQARDERMLTGVTQFKLDYFTPDSSTTTDPSLAKSLQVTLSTAQKVAGKTISQTSGLQVSRANDLPNTPAPSKPIISLYNDGIATFNNTIKASFQWSSSNALLFSVSTRVNGGAWTAPVMTTKTTWEVTTGPHQTADIRVIAYNDTARSDQAEFSTQTKLFTDMNLENGWQCYGSEWSCPGFTRTSAGVILLRGSIKDGTSGLITTLPEGFRPNKQIIFEILGGGNVPARIDIKPNGEVVWMGGANNGWLALNNIHFLPTDLDSSLTWTEPTLTCPIGCTKPWTQYAGGTTVWKKLQFTKDSIGRTHLYGLLSVPTPFDMASNPTNPAFGSIIGTIPTSPINYMPSPTGNDIYPSSSSTNFGNVGIEPSKGIVFRLANSNHQSFAIMYHSSSSTAAWTMITSPMGGDWKNYGGSFTPAMYTKASDGIVSLRGLIRFGATTSGTTLFTLPNGYRPSGSHVYIVAGMNAGVTPAQVSARIDVKADGRVVITSLNGSITNDWLSLAGIHFYAEQ